MKPQLLNEAISTLAKQTGQTYEYTEATLKKHGIILPLPLCRRFADGLDAFYSDMSAHHNIQPSLTKQEFTESCDPNVILDRVNRGQDISVFMTKKTPQFRDITNAPTSYHEALNVVTQANQTFMHLDARLRAKFDNDPSQFVDFVSNPDNAQKLVDMGLATSTAPELPPEAAPAPAAPAKEEGAGGA